MDISIFTKILLSHYCSIVPLLREQINLYFSLKNKNSIKRYCFLLLADRTRLELATLAVTGRCSNQLSYRSKLVIVSLKTFFLQMSLNISLANGLRLSKNILLYRQLVYLSFSSLSLSYLVYVLQAFSQGYLSYLCTIFLDHLAKCKRCTYLIYYVTGRCSPPERTESVRYGRVTN